MTDRSQTHSNTENSGLLTHHTMWLVFPDLSKKCNAITVKDWWVQPLQIKAFHYAPLTCQKILAQPHSATSQKIPVLKNTALETSSLSCTVLPCVIYHLQKPSELNFISYFTETVVLFCSRGTSYPAYAHPWAVQGIYNFYFDIVIC